MHACDEFVRLNPFEPIGVLNEKDKEVRRRGRPSNVEVQQRNAGKVLRDRLRDRLYRKGLSCRGGDFVGRDRHNCTVSFENWHYCIDFHK